MTKPLRRRDSKASERSVEVTTTSKGLGFVRSAIKFVAMKSANQSHILSTQVAASTSAATDSFALKSAESHFGQPADNPLSGFASYSHAYPAPGDGIPDWAKDDTEEPAQDNGVADPQVLFSILLAVLDVVFCVVLGVIGWFGYHSIDTSTPARTANLPILVALGLAGWAIFTGVQRWRQSKQPQSVKTVQSHEALLLFARSVVLSLSMLVWMVYPTTAALVLTWLVVVSIRHALLSSLIPDGLDVAASLRERQRQIYMVLGTAFVVMALTVCIQGRQAVESHPFLAWVDQLSSSSPIMGLLLINSLIFLVAGLVSLYLVRVLNGVTNGLSVHLSGLSRERQFSSVIANLSQGVLLFGADGKILFTNPMMRLITGIKDESLSAGQFIRHGELERVHPEDRRLVAAQLKRVFEEENNQISAFFRIRHTDGNWRYLEALAINMLNTPAVGAIIVSFTDATQRREVERLRLRERKLLRSVIDNLPDGVCIKDKSGLYQLVNRAMALKLGLNSPDDLIGRRAKDIFPKELSMDIDKDDQQLLLTRRAIMGKEVTLDVAGVRRVFEITKLPLVGADINPDANAQKAKGSAFPATEAGPRDGAILVILKEVTKYKEMRQQLEFNLNNDSLTGLLNRRAFTEKIGQAMQEARSQNKQVAVMVLQIDLLKLINSRFGYDAGDHVLVVMVQRLSKLMGDGRLLARIGGAEFGILLHPLDSEESGRAIAVRIQNEIRREVRAESIWGASLDLPLELEPDRPVAPAPELDVSVGLAFMAEAHRRPNELLHEVYTRMLSKRNAT